MRAVELAKVAAAAEALHLRRIARRQGLRAGYGAGAAVFGIAVFVLLHVVAYNLLLGLVNPAVAALILLAVDLVVAGILASLAMSNKPDTIELEALAVRRQAVTEMRRSLTFMSIASSLTGVVLRRRAQQSVGASRSRAWMLGEIAARLLARR